MPAPTITLLTDFGLTDHYVAAMKGVMLTICPEVQFVDISHQVPVYNILHAAWTLSQCWEYFPQGTVHLIVVDPGVGSERRPIVVEAGGHFFVSPDNGVLSMVLKRFPEFNAREITAYEYFRKPVSRTFHGRDIFAPAAARLATGLPLVKLGREIGDPISLEVAEPIEEAENIWIGGILHVDAFGNLVTNFGENRFGTALAERFELQVGSAVITTRKSSYTDPGSARAFVIFGSSGYAEITCFQANAAAVLGVSPGNKVRLRLFPPQ